MNIDALLPSLPLLLKGLWVTLLLSAGAGAAATVLGLLAATARTSRIPVVSQLAVLYVEVFRGSPILLTLLFVYFGAPGFGIEINLITAAIVGLAIYEGAYIAEIFRSGIESVPVGQREVSQVLGFGPVSTFVNVVVPQTRRIVLPPLIGQYIALIKDTSIAFMIGLAELMRQGQSIIDRIGQPVLVYTVVAILYFAVCYPLSRWVRRLDSKAY